MSKQSDIRDRTQAELDKLNCVTLSWETTGAGHQKVTFVTPAGVRMFFIVPSTASDHRSFLNARACLRRKVKQS